MAQIGQGKYREGGEESQYLAFGRLFDEELVLFAGDVGFEVGGCHGFDLAGVLDATEGL